MEIVSSAQEGVEVIPLESLDLRSPLIMAWSNMRSNSTRDELREEIVISDRSPLPMEGNEPITIFGGPLHGKTTAMEQGHSIDIECSLESKTEYLSSHGLTVSDELAEWQSRWAALYENNEEGQMIPGFVTRQVEINELYFEGYEILRKYRGICITSHFNTLVYESVMERNAPCAFLRLPWDELFERGISDDVEQTRLSFAAVYYLNLVENNINGPFYGDVSHIKDIVTYLDEGQREEVATQALPEES